MAIRERYVIVYPSGRVSATCLADHHKNLINLPDSYREVSSKVYMSGDTKVTETHYVDTTKQFTGVTRVRKGKEVKPFHLSV